MIAGLSTIHCLISTSAKYPWVYLHRAVPRMSLQITLEALHCPHSALACCDSGAGMGAEEAFPKGNLALSSTRVVSEVPRIRHEELPQHHAREMDMEGHRGMKRCK